MKTLAIALTLLAATTGAHAANQVYTCDSNIIIGFNGQPSKIIASKAQFATIVDAGDQFQAIVGDNVMTSDKLVQIEPGIQSGVNKGALFVKRQGTYQITMGNNKWLVFDACTKGKGL